jgi:hypothetical protein
MTFNLRGVNVLVYAEFQLHIENILQRVNRPQPSKYGRSVGLRAAGEETIQEEDLASITI